MAQLLGAKQGGAGATILNSIQQALEVAGGAKLLRGASAGIKAIRDIDLPEIKVNPDQPQKIANRLKCQDVRMALGRIVTREDFEKERRRILSKPLP